MRVKLSEIIELIGGGTPKTSVEEYWNGNIPWLSVKDFNNESLEELVRHLNDVGPVSLSMKGQMTSDKKDYYTNGHLIVVTGYFYKDGNLYFYSNDPNVPAVACVYTANVIKNTWRNIAYIIE